MSVAHKLPVSTSLKHYSEKMQQTLASLRLEGIHLSEEDIQDIDAVEKGHLSKKDCLERALHRAKTPTR